MLLKRFYHDGLAQASYMLGCQETGEALVVDANRDSEPYIKAARQNGLRITHVTETHIHADYLSGSRELARATGAKLYLSAEGGRDWQYAFAKADDAQLLHNGDKLVVGNVRVDVVHTPGHTPEHLVFVVTDLKASPHPVGVFTGDFIFVGDVGRPDLLERAANIEGTMRQSASQLFDSLRSFVTSYPDHLQIWPGHGAGSACGKALGAVPQSTLGYEKLSNWALQITDRDAFVAEVLAGQPDPPTYFAAMKRLNREGPAIMDPSLELTRLGYVALEAARHGGESSRLIDVRPAAAFAESFIPGSISIPMNRSFLSYAGWLVDVDDDVFLVTGTDDDQAAEQAARELSFIGVDRIRGWFGAEVVREAHSRGHTETLARVTPKEVSLLGSDSSVQVVDVRNNDEWEAGHMQFAHHIPLGKLEKRISELDPSRPVIVSCQSGSRSPIGVSVLRAHGFTDLRDMRGGYNAWQSAGLADEYAASGSSDG